MTWRCAACHLSADETERYHARAVVCALCRDSAAARGLAWCSGAGRPHRVPAAQKGTRSLCLACEAKRSAARYARNTETRRARQRDYYWAHRDAELAQDKAYRNANRDTINARRRGKRLSTSAYMRQYRAAHREHIRAKSAAWRAAHPGHASAYNKAYRIRKKLSILRAAVGGTWRQEGGTAKQL